MDSVGPTDGVGQSLTAGELLRLRRFREEAFRCLGRRRDALFELVDGLLAAGSMPSLPHVSLVPLHRRGWGSVYAALAVGGLDAGRLAETLTAQLPEAAHPVFAVDASTWARCDAECSPARGFYYSPTRHSAGQPIVAGWCYSWVAQLGFERDSWTAPVDARRLDPTKDVGRATAAQVRAVTGRLRAGGAAPLFVFDAGYDPIALTVDLADLAAAICVRIRCDRVFYATPAPVPGRTGRPPRHGARFCCADPTTWPAPEQTLTADDEQYGRVQVACWSGLHPKLAGRGRWADYPEPPIVTGTVIRVEVEHLPRPTARAVKTLWLWWAGPGRPDLDLCWRSYIHRFRPRAHLPLLQAGPGLDHPAGAHPRAGRPLDLAGPARLHPTAPGPPHRRRHPAALGTAAAGPPADPHPHPAGFRRTASAARHPCQSAETLRPLTRTTGRQPTRTR